MMVASTPECIGRLSGQLPTTPFLWREGQCLAAGSHVCEELMANHAQLNPALTHVVQTVAKPLGEKAAPARFAARAMAHWGRSYRAMISYPRCNLAKMSCTNWSGSI